MVCLLVETRKQKFRRKYGCLVEIEVEKVVFKVMTKGSGVVNSGR
jgi:hypothetical protein